MALLVITSNKETSMVQVFESSETKAMNKQKVTSCINARKARNSKPKTYSREEISNRNNKLIKERIRTKNGYQLFLTLLLPIGSDYNDPHYFALCMQRFGTWFKNRFKHGYADYWFELSNTDMLHSHLNIHTGESSIDIKSIENECYLKWAFIVKNDCKKLCKATQFNKYQLGYMAKKAKRSRSYDLMNMFQHKKTYGTYNKQSKEYIQAHLIEIDDKQKKRLEEYFIAKMKCYAENTNTKLNFWQTSKIRSGFYSQLFLSDIDVSCVYYMVLFDELVRLHGETFPIGDLPEWPSSFQFDPGDEEPLYGPGDEDAIDSYQTILEAA